MPSKSAAAAAAKKEAEKHHELEDEGHAEEAAEGEAEGEHVEAGEGEGLGEGEGEHAEGEEGAGKDAEGSGDADADEMAELQKKLKEWDEEAAKLKAQQEAAEGKSGATAEEEAQREADSRSIFLGNVDFSTTAAQLEEFFAACGAIARVTIPTDRYTNQGKGYAYIEFKEASAVGNAMLLNETELNGRPLKVAAKRTNTPWHARGGGVTSSPARGRGRGRGATGGFYPPVYGGGRGAPMMMVPMPMPMMGYGMMPYGAPRGGRGGFRGAPRGGRGRGRGAGPQ